MIRAAQICSSLVFLFALLVCGALFFNIAQTLVGGPFASVVGPLAGLMGVAVFIGLPSLTALIALGSEKAISRNASLSLFMNKVGFVLCFVWPFGPAVFVKLMQIPQVRTYFGICFLCFILNALALEKKKKLPTVPKRLTDPALTKEQINRIAEEGDLAFKDNRPKSSNPYILPNATKENLELASFWDRGYISAEKKQ